MDIEMFWIDIETTGLDANNDVPLEVSCALTNKYGGVIDQQTWLVWEGHSEYEYAVDRAKHNDIVGPMHTESGLWEDLLNVSMSRLNSRRNLDTLILEWLKVHNVEPNTLPMSGASIGSLDRPFVLVHFPLLNRFLHHRNIDVSTVKELCRMHNSELAKRIKEKRDAIAKDFNEHRASEDVQVSIAEYRLYVDNFLFIEDDEDYLC